MDGRQALRRLAGLPVLAVDGMLGAAVAGVQLVLLALGAAPGGPLTFRPLDPLGVALIVAQGAALTWRRQRPLAVFVAVFIPNTLYYLFSYPPSGFDFGLGVAIWTLAAYASRPVSMLGWGTLLATWLTQWLTEAGAYFRYARWPTLLYLLFWASAFWAWGRSARRVRAAHAAELAAQAERLERDRELEAQRAVAAERARIARELHDVVAHHVSMMVVQAEAGPVAVEHDPARAAGAFEAIAATGRQALVEMRRLLGMLRGGEEPAPSLAPQPSLAEVPSLVEQVGRAGLRVELVVEGTEAALPPGIDLSAYRIIQEALTNAVKHGGSGRARVLVRYGPDDLRLQIRDEGRPAGGNGAPVERRPDAAQGRGLLGMRERVALFGGELHVGPGPDGGFSVDARLPIGTAGR
ncbi:MAG: sensor histidine kinase [Actinomycetota bacterium]